MHAYLLVSPIAPSQERLEKLIGTKYSNFVSFCVSTVSEVREFKRSLLFVQNGETLIVLTGIEIAKAEAQNALLKTIEEPPHDHLAFVVVTNNIELVLQTILSRVSILPKSQQLHEEMNLDFAQKPSNEWFYSFSKISDREEAIKTMEALNASGKLEGVRAEAAIECIKALKANGSLQLQFTNFILKGLS